ncbi:thymidine kinase [Thiotrichales bacterium 19S9-12]|nr:thymidine kinase [Thiotrichales bacterium 19S9-11]MCF6812583.1 thymidine kinase [Thiotrichales bacterium 19S9-12]
MAKLYFYYSSMNAGKSTILLQSDYNYRERGMNTLLLTPKIDNRAGQHKIGSRIGLEADAISFNSDTNLYQITQLENQNNPINCVLIDEAQFLNKAQVYQLSEVVDQLNIPVLAYGLRNDFQAEPFEGSKYLLAWADNLVEIKTVCHCGKKATHVLRHDEKGNVIEVGSQVQIGGNDNYTAVCRKHYKKRTIN